VEDHIEPAGWALGLSGVALLLGAWIAHRTGEQVHGMRTHMEATLVLGCLGLVLLGNGLGAVAYGRDAVRRRERAVKMARFHAEEEARREAREALRAQQRAQQRDAGD